MKKEYAKRGARELMLCSSLIAISTSAYAQDADDEIVVTGSRIAREDLSAPSPIQTVTSEQLTLTNTVNSEQFLNTLPQVIPAFDSTSNNPGNGTATVNLRGLGTNRTLVLVDGSRFVASGPGGVVDINSIPAALVQRIDVVTGGASAVYGSDAVAGVVNFILKDDFEGVQLDVSDEMSAAGWDANIFNAALTMGGNFADGRGNAILSLSYTNREALFQGDRAFSSTTLQDDGAGGFLLGGSGSALGGQFTSLANRDGETNNFDNDPLTPNDPLIDGLDDEASGFLNGFQGAPFYACTSATGATCSNNITFNGAAGGRRFTDPADQYNYAPINYLQIPQERYSIYAGGSYEINDHVEVYARGVFAQSVVDTQLAPTPVSGTFTLNLDNPNINPTFLNALLATYDYVDPDPTTDGYGRPSNGDRSDIQDRDGDGQVDDILISFARRYNDDAIGPRNSLRDASTFQIKLGLRGDLGENWNWDVYGQFGRVSNSQTQTGNISFSALQTGILSGACNVFGVNTIDAACGAAIRRTGIIATQVEQTQIVGTVSGVMDGFKSPWAESGIGLAFGVEYREEFANALPDSVLGPDVRGFNASLPVSGRYDAYEAFMETDIPLVENSGVGDISVNGAYRFSSYSTGAGDVSSFAAGLEWKPMDGLRFRGQFQRAVRAPNINELFGAFTNGFPTASDPCSRGPNSPGGQAADFGSFVAANAANCAAFGVPAGQIGSAFQLAGQIEALFGGNANVKAETADTYTVGMVWQPSFLEGAVLQVDYYDISIKDAIATPPLQLLLDQCYVQGRTDVCNQYFGPGTRDPNTGQMTGATVASLGVGNFASLAARGIDITIGYGFDVGSMGSVDVKYFGNYTFESSFQSDPSAPVIECAGFFGINCGEPTPEYKHTMQASWLYGPLTTSLRWRYIGGVDLPAAEITANGIGDASDDIGTFNYLDVTMQYAVNENLGLTIGVQNILGKDAPLLGSTVNEQANTWPATYETLGRQLFFGASLKF